MSEEKDPVAKAQDKQASPDKSATKAPATKSKAGASKAQTKQAEPSKASSKPSPASSSASKPTPKPASKPAPKSTGGGAKLALVVALIALAGSAYVGYQNLLLTQQLNANAQQAKASDQAQVNQQQAIVDLGKQLQALQQQDQQQIAASKQQQQAMDSALQQALEQMAQQQNEHQQQLPKWELAEAEYLLRLANQRLAMEQNPAVALPLLQGADEIMRLSEQLGSYGVRKAIAADMAALSGVAVVDVEGIYAHLAALALQTAKLTYVAPTAVELVSAPLASAPAKVALSEPQTTTQQVLSAVTQVAGATWQELRGLVTVQQRTGVDQLLLTPEKEALQRMRMELAFAQAQAALLRGQQGVYSRALDLAASILHDYYRPDDAVAQAMLGDIVSLQAVQVMVAMPDISGSLQALQQLQAAIHQQGE